MLADKFSVLNYLFKNIWEKRISCESMWIFIYLFIYKSVCTENIFSFCFTDYLNAIYQLPTAVEQRAARGGTWFLIHSIKKAVVV